VTGLIHCLEGHVQGGRCLQCFSLTGLSALNGVALHDGFHSRPIALALECSAPL
jgi:hypothetical protein